MDIAKLCICLAICIATTLALTNCAAGQLPLPVKVTK